MDKHVAGASRLDLSPGIYHHPLVVFTTNRGADPALPLDGHVACSASGDFAAILDKHATPLLIAIALTPGSVHLHVASR